MPRSVEAWGTYFNRNGDKYDSVNNSTGILDVVTFSSGETWSYYYASNRLLKFIVSSRGYGLQFSYSGSNKSIIYYNKAYVYCNEAALVDCSSVSGLSTKVTISTDSNGVTVSPPGSAGFRYQTAFGGLSAYSDISSISTVGVSGSTKSYTYTHTPDNGSQAQNNSIATVFDGQNTWTYSHPAQDEDAASNPYAFTFTTATDPTSKWTQGDGYNFIGAIQNFRDEIGRYTYYLRDNSTFQTVTVALPEGNGIKYTHDGRGNVTSEEVVPKSASGLSSIFRLAEYPALCTVANFKYCNKPSWVKDAKGVQTDLTYNADNGLPLSITQPADSSGIRPQKRYAYVQRSAWVLNSSGGYVQAGAPIWLLASESYCRTSSATGNPAAPCAAGASDEVKTVYDYGPDSGPSNLFLRGVTVTAEKMVSGALTMVTLRTCYGNDRNGRRIWATKPRANLASCS
jgi:hypothetical protein